MRLLIDLSDLVAWSGSFTGIQRVAWSLASRYAGRAGVELARYDTADGRFRAIDVDELRRRFETAVQPSARYAGVALERMWGHMPRALRDVVSIPGMLPGMSAVLTIWMGLLVRAP